MPAHCVCYHRWMFEKYDGVRGFWNPTKKVFFSRTGKRIAIPTKITDAMPTNIFLDGELWYIRTILAILPS